MTPRHLTSDEIILAAVDRADLEPGLRSHLEGCAQCAAELAKLQAGLGSLGEKAREAIPVPGRKFSLAGESPARRRPAPLRWGYAGAALAAAAGLLLLLWPAKDIPPAGGADVILAGMAQESGYSDPSLLYWQPEEGFSEFQRFVLAEEQPTGDTFLDFVAPESNDLTSYRPQGRTKC